MQIQRIFWQETWSRAHFPPSRRSAEKSCMCVEVCFLIITAVECTIWRRDDADDIEQHGRLKLRQRAFSFGRMLCRVPQQQCRDPNHITWIPSSSAWHEQPVNRPLYTRECSNWSPFLGNSATDPGFCNFHRLQSPLDPKWYDNIMCKNILLVCC